MRLPSFQLVFLKLSVLLFPASDYRHPVTTPALQIMSHVLSATRFAMTHMTHHHVTQHESYDSS